MNLVFICWWVVISADQDITFIFPSAPGFPCSVILDVIGTYNRENSSVGWYWSTAEHMKPQYKSQLRAMMTHLPWMTCPLWNKRRPWFQLCPSRGWLQLGPQSCVPHTPPALSASPLTTYGTPQRPQFWQEEAAGFRCRSNSKAEELHLSFPVTTSTAELGETHQCSQLSSLSPLSNEFI